MAEQPKPTSGMRHVALCVANIEVCEQFYVGLLGMTVEWRPDSDNVYLTSGNDNLALHKTKDKPSGAQVLDHIGFIINEIEQIDVWHDFFVDKGVKILKQPRTHRDGARSFYCSDPEGLTVQLIYHPPLVSK